MTLYSGLKEDVIDRIRGVLAHYPDIDKAILFGSRAKGNEKTGSDIDLTLIGNKLNLRIHNALENELDDLLIPYSIDLSIYHHIDNPDLKDHIRRVGRLFYIKATR